MSETLLDSSGDTGTPPATAAPEPTPAVTGETTTNPTGELNGQTGDTAVTPPASADVSKDTTSDGQSADEPQGDDWAAMRTRIANGDDKLLNILSRYSTVEDAIRGGVEAKRKLGERAAPKVPDANSSPEEIKQYREQLGIPENAKDYKVELPDDMVLGEMDKPVADAFLEVAHKHNLPPGAVNDIIAHQLKFQEQMQQEQEEADAASRVKAEETLMSKEVWGSETKLNINMIRNMFSGAPDGVGENLMGARLADGTLLGNNVNVLRWLSNTARELNPYATVTPSAGQTNAEAVADRLASLEKLMGDHNSEYWKGPKADAMQEEYRKLYEIKEKGDARSR